MFTGLLPVDPDQPLVILAEILACSKTRCLSRLSQLGSDVQATVVELNKPAGPSHGKVNRVFASFFDIARTSVGSVHTVLRAALQAGLRNDLSVHRAVSVDRPR
jgi:hypothetical protein